MISAIPTDGNAFTLGCETGSCGTAMATLLSIVTTDGVIPGGAPPWAMPAPVTKSVEVRCAGIGTTSITVPAEASVYLQGSGATRIETRFSRSGIAAPVTSEPVLITVGHAVIGWTTP